MLSSGEQSKDYKRYFFGKTCRSKSVKKSKLYDQLLLYRLQTNEEKKRIPLAPHQAKSIALCTAQRFGQIVLTLYNITLKH